MEIEKWMMIGAAVVLLLVLGIPFLTSVSNPFPSTTPDGTTYAKVFCDVTVKADNSEVGAGEDPLEPPECYTYLDACRRWGALSFWGGEGNVKLYEADGGAFLDGSVTDTGGFFRVQDTVTLSACTAQRELTVTFRSEDNNEFTTNAFVEVLE